MAANNNKFPTIYLASVIPATNIPLPGPQILTYFTTHDLKVGSLVLVPVHRREAVGVVRSMEKLDGQKMHLRQAEFELRSITKIINKEKILDEKQISLAQWVHQYYWCPMGPVIKKMIPTKSQKSKVKSQKCNSKLKSGGGKQILILVPEIAVIDKLTERHKNSTALHSGLTDRQYFENWQKIKKGQIKIIIGTRSALFAPYANLKEILIEDEHSQNYKSQQMPRIHARETAIKLAELWNAKITLKSPTPSLEAQYLAYNKKFILQVPVPSSQFPIPDIIDLRQELKEGNFSIFSRELQKELTLAIQKKQQAILFINRRGASTVILCRDCGHIPMCPNCETPLVYHLSPIRFLCHHCGHSQTPPTLCPNCRGSRIKFLGAGTQKVEAEFKKLFPKIKVLRLDSDIIKSQKAEQQIIEEFKTGKASVLIGTQMLLGNDLKKVSLAAVILADALLNLPDFRSSEKTIQNLMRLKPLARNKFLIQTYSPENSAFKAMTKNDYLSFCKTEIATRKTLNYPPFSQIIKLSFQHKNPEKAEQEAKILIEKLKQQILSSDLLSLITILGPSPAFIPKVKGKFAWQIILKSNIAKLEDRNKILQIIPPNWTIDVDSIKI